MRWSPHERRLITRWQDIQGYCCATLTGYQTLKHAVWSDNLKPAVQLLNCVNELAIYTTYLKRDLESKQDLMTPTNQWSGLLPLLSYNSALNSRIYSVSCPTISFICYTQYLLSATVQPNLIHHRQASTVSFFCYSRDCRVSPFVKQWFVNWIVNQTRPAPIVLSIGVWLVNLFWIENIFTLCQLLTYWRDNYLS